MSSDVFKFAFITDAQLGMNSPGGLEAFGGDKLRLDRAIAYANDPEHEIEFVVLGGDQVNNFCSEEQAEKEFSALELSLSTLTVPYYGVAGNHDVERPGDEPQYIQRGLPVHFSMAHGNSYFVGINSVWLRGRFGEAQQEEEWDYMESQFAAAPADCKHVFVVMHWPLFIAHPDEPETYWNMPNRARIIDVFKKYNVSCALSGHFHQDIDARWHGISLITSIGICAPLQYAEERSFKIVTVFPDGWSTQRVSVDSL